MNVSRSEQGFVFPLAIGVGLIVILLGIMIIERSHQKRITAIAYKDNDRSLAAAEAGVAQFQSLLMRYRPLAAFCSSDLCNGKSKNWQTLSDPDLETNFCTTTPPPGAAELIKDYSNDFSNNAWKNLGSNEKEGQFRLVKYTYQTVTMPPTGELIVEGRANPNTNGNSFYGTAVTRLKVKFAVPTPPPPGLWIKSNEESGASNLVQIKSDLRDSTCLNNSNSSKISQLQSKLQPNFSYKSTPGEKFPSLPTEGNSPIPLKNPGAYSLPAIDDTLTLPNNIQTADSNHILAFNIAEEDGKSINLNDGKILEIGTGAETVVLYLEGEMTVSDNSKIVLKSGSKLVIYAHKKVTLAGTATHPAIQQLASTPSSANVKLFVYNASDINLSGDAPIHLFVLAPDSTVTSSAKVEGSIWSKAWVGSNSAVIHQDIPTQDLQLNTTWPIRISPITAWQRLEAR